MFQCHWMLFYQLPHSFVQCQGQGYGPNLFLSQVTYMVMFTHICCLFFNFPPFLVWPSIVDIFNQEFHSELTMSKYLVHQNNKFFLLTIFFGITVTNVFTGYSYHLPGNPTTKPSAPTTILNLICEDLVEKDLRTNAQRVYF